MSLLLNPLMNLTTARRKKTRYASYGRHHTGQRHGDYITIPDYPLESGQLASGYRALAARLVAGGSVWMVDGMSGTNWAALRAGLEDALAGHAVTLIDVSSARVSADDVRTLLAGSLDNGDSVFAKIYEGTMSDFFDPRALQLLREEALRAAEGEGLVVCYGQGAALLELEGSRAWVDLPKEIVLETRGRRRERAAGHPSVPRHEERLLGRLARQRASQGGAPAPT